LDAERTLERNSDCANDFFVDCRQLREMVKAGQVRGDFCTFLRAKQI
jgi:hypothetical protein